MNFPQELKNQNQWLVWKFEQYEGDKKPRKVPYYVSGKKRFGKQGDESDLAALSDFSTASALVDFGQYDGLGFALLPNDNLIGIDIDSNADPELVKKLIAGINSYTEVSPSGSGYHIWVNGSTRTFKDNNVGIEVFCNAQFLTMTGKHVDGTPFEVNPISDKALERLREIVKGKRSEPQRPSPEQPVSDHSKIESALAFISSECGYDDWYKIGAAIYSALGESGFSVFDYWSSKSSKYNPNGMRQKYQSFANIHDINPATLYKRACDNGWKPPRDPNWKPEPKQKTPEPIAVPEPKQVEEIKKIGVGVGKDTYFRCLGYDHDDFYILQFEKRQITQMRKGDFTESGLLALAPNEWWEMFFPNSKSGIDRTKALDWIFRECYKAGVFKPDAIRGRGAWIDEGRVVYHFGSHLLVDGKKVDMRYFESDYIYEVSKKIKVSTDQVLTETDGRKILQTAKMFRFTRPASAPLLCGWLMLSRICGALKWRPHVWITGESGSGKSTIVDRFIHTFVLESSVFAQGNSTEAGIRQRLNSDAIPVLFDESEQNNEREQNRVQNILSLIRQASSQSGAQTLKGTATGSALNFNVRSMFMLSSIQVSMLMQADRERITVLALQPKRQTNAADQWKILEKNLVDIGLDEKIGDRLFLRAITMLPQILKNIEVFRNAAARFFGTVREGDQYGTMLAGCWSLCEDRPATEEDAKSMIEKLDWEDYTVEQDDNESKKALAAILERKVRSNFGELTIYEVINTAKNGLDIKGHSDFTKDEAEALLARYGMRLDDTGILISNNSNAITDLLRGSQYQADWRGQVMRVEGITKYKKPVRINGIVSRCIHADFDVIGV